MTPAAGFNKIGFYVRQDVVDCLLPRQRVSAAEWVVKNILVEGKPFNANDYPWATAPYGPCEAFDDPEIRDIDFQGSAQIGKTVVARSLFLCGMESQPSNGIFASSTEKLACNNVRKKLYPAIDDCLPLREQLPPPHSRLQTRVDLRHGSIYVGWSGSISTLSDITARFGHAGEVDKWAKQETDEADPLELFDERFGAVPNHKKFHESTPAVAATSRINRRLLRGTNSRYHIPCPRCGVHQELIFGDGDEETGGVFFDRDENGHLDPEIAYQTARYHCPHCHEEWQDHEKMPAIRKGVWCAEGCKVNKRGHRIGHPLRPYPSASFHISRLYSPSITFGHLARQFVLAQSDQDKYRSFLNSWLGQPWTPIKGTASWEEIAEKLGLDYSMGKVPADAMFLTCGVDIQIDHVVYFVAAWGKAGTGWLIDWGTTLDLSALEKQILDHNYPQPEKNRELPISITLIDSKYEQEPVYEFCKRVSYRGRWVWPCQGAKAGAMQGVSWRPRREDEAGTTKPTRRKGVPDFLVITVNTNYWQSYADSCLYQRRPPDVGSFALPIEAQTDQDLIDQMLNERVNDERSPIVWEPVAEALRWDFRDTWRYARCAAEVFVWNKWERLTAAKAIIPQQRSQQQSSANQDEKSSRRRRPKRAARRRR